MNPKAYLLLAGPAFLFLAANSQPITDAQALETGHRLEAVTNKGESYPIGHFMYADSMLANIRKKSKSLKDPGIFASFKSSFTPTFNNGTFGKQVMANIRDGSFRMLREYDQGGVKHLVFRVFGSGGLNYDDFILVRVGDSVKAGDLYTYSLDEWTSSQIARLTDMALESDNDDNLNAVKNMTDQAKRQDYAGVKTSFEKLDKKYQHNKFVLTIYIQACHHIDLGLYEKALIEYSEDFPDATSGYLLMLDLYYLQKQYDKALAAVDKLDKLIGGDPLLNFFRGNLFSLMGKNTEGLACYEKVYHYDPSLKINVVRLASLYADANQKEKAQAVIMGYMNTAAYHPGDLNELYDKYPGLK